MYIKVFLLICRLMFPAVVFAYCCECSVLYIKSSGFPARLSSFPCARYLVLVKRTYGRKHNKQTPNARSHLGKIRSTSNIFDIYFGFVFWLQLPPPPPIKRSLDLFSPFSTNDL